MRSIALDVLTLTFEGMKLCMSHHKSAILLYIRDLPMCLKWEQTTRSPMESTLRMHHRHTQLVVPVSQHMCKPNRSNYDPPLASLIAHMATQRNAT